MRRALCLLLVATVLPLGAEALFSAGGVVLTNVDIPYGCAPYNVSSPLPLLLVNLTTPCALPAGFVAPEAAFVAFVHFQDAVSNAGCHSYADLVRNVLPQLTAAGAQVTVASQAYSAATSPGYVDFYGDISVYQPPVYALTVVSPTDGDALVAAIGSSASYLNATVEAAPNPWTVFAASPAYMVERVLYTVAAIAVLVFIVFTQGLIIARKGVLRYRWTSAVLIQWMVACMCAVLIVDASVDPDDYLRRLGPFPAHLAILTASLFFGLLAFCLLMLAWARAAASGRGIDGHWLRLFRGFLAALIVSYMAAMPLMTVYMVVGETNTPLEQAYTAMLVILAVFLVTLCVTLVALGIALLRILSSTGGTPAVSASAASALLMRNITLQMLASVLTFAGLCLSMMADAFLYCTPPTELALDFIFIILVFGLVTCVLMSLRYDVYNSQKSSYAHSGSAPASPPLEPYSLGN